MGRPRREPKLGGVVVNERYERRIAMTMLADFVLMGHENAGSFALSSDKTALFAVALGGWLDGIADIFNLHAIPRLVALNGWPTDRCPRLVHGDIEAPNLAALGDNISKLYGAGMQLFPDGALENHLRRVAGLPRRSPDPSGAKHPAGRTPSGERVDDPEGLDGSAAGQVLGVQPRDAAIEARRHQRGVPEGPAVVHVQASRPIQRTRGGQHERE